MPSLQHSDFRDDARFSALLADLEDSAENLFSKFLFDGIDSKAALNEVLGRFEKVIQSASGPVFDDDGFIPPIQVCTEAEVAHWFGFSDRRRSLLNRVREWISLARAVEARRLLLDGSFVTAKDEPGDVDAVVLLPEDFHDRLDAGNPAAAQLRDIFRTRDPGELFAAEDEEDWWGWFGFFSRTRKANGRHKGLIEVAL
jgi:hypothetical protein